MNDEKKEFLPAVTNNIRSQSILDAGVAALDAITLMKRSSAKEAAETVNKNKVKTATQKRYAAVHGLYDLFCDELKTPKVPTHVFQAAETIYYFISCSIVNKDIKPQTVAVYLAAMRNYFHEKKAYDVNPTKLDILSDLKKSSSNITESNEPEFNIALDINHIIEMINKCDLSTLRGMMHRAIIAFTYCSACRRSEVARLHTSEMRESIENDGYIINIKTKTTRKEKKIKALKGIPLRAYIKEWKIAAGIVDGYLFRKISKNGKLFNSKNLKHITGNEVNNILKMYAADIDPSLRNEDISAHDMRRGVASYLLKKGAPLKSVQNLMAHETSKMTLHYHKIQDGWKEHAANVLNEKEDK